MLKTVIWQTALFVRLKDGLDCYNSIKCLPPPPHTHTRSISEGQQGHLGHRSKR